MGHTLLALTHMGAAFAFNLESPTITTTAAPAPVPLLLNEEPTQVIRSIFHNPFTDEVLTVSVHSSEQYESLSTRAIPVDAIER